MMRLMHETRLENQKSRRWRVQGRVQDLQNPNPGLQPCIQQAHSLCASLHCLPPGELLQTRRGSFYIPQPFTNLSNLCEHPINLTLKPLLFLHPWKKGILLLSQAKCPASAWDTSPVSQPGKLICNSVIFIALSFLGTSHDR